MKDSKHDGRPDVASGSSGIQANQSINKFY